MCKQVKATEFRQNVIKLARGKDHNTIFEYLRTTGMVMKDREGMITIEEDCLKKVDFLTSEVEVGDLVWNAMQGILLVVDKHPRANNDGHHFRSLRVTTDVEGNYQILCDERSLIIDDKETFRLRRTSFDMKLVEKLIYERYLAYSKIAEINTQLTSLKEENND